MSFSDSVREELYSRMNDQDKKYACLYGILLYCRTFTASRIRLQSESPVCHLKRNYMISFNPEISGFAMRE